jgi:hypothetical protein
LPERDELSPTYNNHHYNLSHNHYYNLSRNYHHNLYYYYHNHYRRDLRHLHDLFLLPDSQLLSFWLWLSPSFLLSQQLELCSCP